MPRLQAVLWDLDGTIVDTEPLFEQAIIAFKAQHQMSGKLSDVKLGHCLRTTWEILNDDAPEPVTFDQWSQEIFQAVLERFSVHGLKPNVKHVIETLHAQGIMQICVSNSYSPFIEAALELTGLRPCFAGIVGRDHVARGKPAPDPYFKALEDHGLTAQACLVIEDSAVGTQAAQSAGLRVVAVAPHEDGVIVVPDPDFIAHDRQEILSIIHAL